MWQARVKLISAADRLALFLKCIINKLLLHNKRGIKVPCCLFVIISELFVAQTHIINVSFSIT